MNSKKFSILSFKYAFEGLIAALKEEPNLKFHLLTGLTVLLISFFLKISKQDLVIIILVIGFVIAIELTNTAIEAVVDQLIKEKHPGAKLAKDISASAVLVAAITASIIGVLVFLPYLT